MCHNNCVTIITIIKSYHFLAIEMCSLNKLYYLSSCGRKIELNQLILVDNIIENSFIDNVLQIYFT